jgi:uncharacterized protein YndB with AHSA1/START domain
VSSVVDASSLNEPVVIVTRMLDAPRSLVWEAITDPKHVAHWYGGPGFTNPVCEMDVKPGGIWRHVMQAPNGAQFTINSVFLEVVEPERLVWKTIKDENRKPPPPTAVNTVTLEEQGAQTKWTLVARFDSMSDRDISAGMGFGKMIGMGADRLAEHLGTM